MVFHLPFCLSSHVGSIQDTMRTPQALPLHFSWRFLTYTLLFVKGLGLNKDGILLLSFKYSVLSDPLGVLDSWNYSDETPCSWNGVTCGPPGASGAGFSRVSGVFLPHSQLLGSIPDEFGQLQYLKNLDFSNNSINGSLPLSIFNASELQMLDISDNLISGELPDHLIGGLKNLVFLNLSDNALAGKIPQKLSLLNNLTVVALKNNYFSGNLPASFDSAEILDLSSNLINGSLPESFGGKNLYYLNISHNSFSGKIPASLADKLPANATIDLSYNNFSGPIPDSTLFLNQNKKSFTGNPQLCGFPLKTLCDIPSESSTPEENASSPTPTSSPAIATIPKTTGPNPEISANSSANPTEESQQENQTGRLKPTTTTAIVVGDIAGIGLIALFFIYIYQRKKTKNSSDSNKKAEAAAGARDFDWASSSSSEEDHNCLKPWTCLKPQKETAGDSSETSEATEIEQAGENEKAMGNVEEKKGGSLVTVDGGGGGGEKELELETLLKASAYILGVSGSSIMYKAVLEDGTALAVRRIGESGVERFKDFENQVRFIAKLVHPNLVKIRGFYWGADEKLVIYDFLPNGSLANARYRKAGTSPCHLPWEVRLRIAKGVARGLNYIHDKKHVHGNLKPSNVLLGHDMEPKIGDFGLERLVTGDNSNNKVGGSSRNFGSKRSTASRDSFQDNVIGPTPSPSPSSLSVSPYHAPESLRSLKPNPKWDVYSYGVVLLELLTGKLIVTDDLAPGTITGDATLAPEERNRILRMADVAIRADMEGKEEALLALLKLGYNCISPVPQKRPHMKEVLHALEKLPASSSSSSSSSYYFGQ